MVNKCGLKEIWRDSDNNKFDILLYSTSNTEFGSTQFMEMMQHILYCFL